MGDAPKLSYIASQHRVKCEFTRLMVLETRKVPLDLIARAKAKLDQVQSSGQIGFYLLFEERLKSVWNAAANSENSAVDQKISVTIGAGAPFYAGISCQKVTGEKSIATLDIDIPTEQISNMRYDWFKLNIIYRLREIGISDQISNAQIFSLFQRTIARGETKKVVLNSMASFDTIQPSKKIAILANKQRREIAVILRDVRELKEKQGLENMLGLVDQAVKQMSADGVQYKMFRKDLNLALKSAFEGPENFGVELPLTLLVAVGEMVNSQTGTENKLIPGYPGVGKLNLKASSDKMQVFVDGFDINLYNDKSFQVSVDWIRKELTRCQFKGHLNQETLDDLASAIEKKESLNQKVLLRGTRSVGGQQPYLKLSFKDAGSRRPEANLDIDALNIRDMQQRVLVKGGQLVAELVYKVPPILGCDVYGKNFPPETNDELVVIAGEGIVESEPGRYFATADGIPSVEDNTISLSKILIHEGDVNLRSGNIRFDGPVEINGAIDSGAVVETTGDLLVNGEIRGAVVEALGNVVVKGGVTTSEKGSVFCGGNFSAEFVENSRLTVKGDISVKKALINSKVVCGAGIKIFGKEGIIAGGTTITKESLHTPNLGFARGALSILNIGVDWRVARAIEIKNSRLEKILARQQNDRLMLREMVQKTKNHANQKQKDLKEDLQNRLVRMRAVCEKLESQINDYKNKLSYNSSARIYVSETLMANVNLTIGGQVVAILNDLKSVCVLSKRRRGSFVVPLEEIEEEEKEAKTRMAS